METTPLQDDPFTLFSIKKTKTKTKAIEAFKQKFQHGEVARGVSR